MNEICDSGFCDYPLVDTGTELGAVCTNCGDDGLIEAYFVGDGYGNPISVQAAAWIERWMARVGLKEVLLR